MTFEEYIKKYEAKTGNKHSCPDGFTTLYDKDKGYAQYKVENNRLYIYELCGDCRYWYDLGIKMCKDHNIPFIVTILIRNIMPYLRLLRLKPTIKYQQPERHNGWKFEGVNHLGLRFFGWPAWWDEEKQIHAYYIVTEIIRDGENENIKV